MLEVGAQKAGRRKNCGFLQNQTQVNTSLEFEMIEDLSNALITQYNFYFILIKL